jgi:hypothetical protein
MVVRSGNDDDAILILKLLHETGFINPRVPDARQPRGFRHILFSDAPHFVEKANWNGMQAAIWEIHPAFRSYLLGAKMDQQAQRGSKFE